MPSFTGHFSLYLPNPGKNRPYSWAFHKKYRSHFEIIALMLEAAKDSGSAKFSIMRHSSVNCKQLNKYLKSLVQMGFLEIEIRRSQILYRASEKGLEFLRHYYVLQSMLLTSAASKLDKIMRFPEYSDEEDIVSKVCRTPLGEGP